MVKRIYGKKNILNKLIVFYFLITAIIPGCARHQTPEMVFIEGGTFLMGSPGDEYGRDPDEMQREITIGSFYIGVYEVTQKEYKKITGKNPGAFKGNNLPVESINWYNALDYCNRLSEKEGLTPVYKFSGVNAMWDITANGYRLPTEAEWEYSCRAGTAAAFNTGSSITSDQANFEESLLEKTSPVGSFPPNPWGLYDMHGNVFEWCWDLYGIYSRESTTDPTGAQTGTYRVIRGGSWGNNQGAIRSAYRNFFIPASGNDRIGFRLARNSE